MFVLILLFIICSKYESLYGTLRATVHQSAQFFGYTLSPLSPCRARSETGFVHARKKIGSLRAGDGGQAPASGSG